MAKSLNPVTPGDILLHEFLVPLDLSQNQLARDIDVPPGRINEIVRARRSVTADTALRLGVYFGTTAQFWLNLQNRYDLEMAEQAFDAATRKRIARRRPAAE
ncbi:MAG: HigA family addiction module antitoxin [Pseudomonadota bacterium]